jgi:hypothetical protein
MISSRQREGSRSVFISAARLLDRRRVCDEGGNVSRRTSTRAIFKEP